MTRARDQDVLIALASVLRELRAASGLTQEELGNVAGVDRTFVGRLESGRHQASLSVIFALARALGTTPEDVVQRVRISLERASG